MIKQSKKNTREEKEIIQEEFASYKDCVQGVLEGWRPPIKFEVIQGGKK
jgi:hypothetical protein